jgi:hypothetical protein
MFTLDSKVTYQKHCRAEKVTATVRDVFAYMNAHDSFLIHSTAGGYLLLHFTRQDGTEGETYGFTARQSDGRPYIRGCTDSMLVIGSAT